MNFDNVPMELQAKKSWLVWKFWSDEERAKKPLKMPHYVGTGRWRKGQHGSREDRSQLATFTAAKKAVETSKLNYEGIGLAMLPDLQLVAVDFDDCVKSGRVHPDVLSLVAPTYWELSPSGKGVRAFFKGHLMDGKSISPKALKEHNRTWGVEFFCAAGFVTVTGNITEAVELNGNDIIPLTDAVRDLHKACIGSADVNRDNKGQPPVGMTDDEIKRMLESWDPSCDYHEWLDIGMAIHHETQGDGFDLWNDWSSEGVDYPGERLLEYKWESFGRSDKTSLKTIRWMINAKGLDFALEAQGCDFAPLPKKLDAAGEVVKPMPALHGISADGEIPSSSLNINAILRRPDKLGWEFRYDVFKDQVVVQRYGDENAWDGLRDTDYNRVQEILDAMNFKNPPKEKVRDGIKRVAEENEFDSAIHWLENMVPEWDGVERVKHLCSKYMGVDATDEAYVQAVGLYAMTAHAGRILEPGIKADMVPVLMGKEGVRKTSVIEALAPHDELFTEISFKDSDAVNTRKTRGCVAVECAELQGLGGREANSTKAFISRRFEKHTAKYEEMAKAIARRYLFWGTSNDMRFLSVNESDNRRWLPLHVERNGNPEGIKDMRDQLWAEARELYKRHGVMHQSANELALPHRKSATECHPWQELIEDALNEYKDENGVLLRELDYIVPSILWEEVLGIVKSSRNSANSRTLAAIMRNLGYERARTTIDGHQTRVYKREI